MTHGFARCFLRETEEAAHLIRSFVAYDPESGVFRWLKGNRNQVLTGATAGYLHPDGYRYIKVKGQRFTCHRLAWLLGHGVWPTETVDHINLNKSDNRLINLRLATISQNGCNRAKNSNNTTGFKGVTYVKREGKFLAVIGLQRKKHSLGSFDTAEEAGNAYAAAAEALHGEFSRA